MGVAPASPPEKTYSLSRIPAELRSGMACHRVHLRNPSCNTPGLPSFLINTHVLEARDVAGASDSPCDSYVKVGLVPDGDPGNRFKTDMVPSCKNPVFLQTFSLSTLK
ncbi:hypothetical protein CRUP_003729 [Coryphaenoides rupestris]|nr:hypothetical protein CRUP_003729 [Coryphaenoides rupestris]